MCEVVWYSNGNGWGSNNLKRTIEMFDYRWCEMSPVYTISQMTHSSKEVVYLRGGSKYNISTTEYNATITLHTSAYTEKNETIQPIQKPDFLPTIKNMGYTGDFATYNMYCGVGYANLFEINSQSNYPQLVFRNKYSNYNNMALLFVGNNNDFVIRTYDNTDIDGDYSNMSHVYDFRFNAASKTFFFSGSSGISGGGYIKNVADIYFTSDKRYKTNIRSIRSKPKLLCLEAKQYDLVSDNNRYSIGYVAQEVKKLCPRIVSENSDGYLSISYRELHTLLIEMLRRESNKHSKEIQKLKNRLTELEQKVKPA